MASSLSPVAALPAGASGTAAVMAVAIAALHVTSGSPTVTTIIVICAVGRAPTVCVVCPASAHHARTAVANAREGIATATTMLVAMMAMTLLLTIEVFMSRELWQGL